MSEIYTMTSSMLNQSKIMDVVSNNIANASTVGYKRQDISFKSVMAETQQQAENGMSFSTVNEKTTDFSTGDFKITNNKLDMAVNGDGFFALQRGDSTVYTKNGRFSLNSTGQLVSQNGEKVLGIDSQPIDIPANSNVRINSSGEVRDNKGAMFGQIAVFQFNDKSTLVPAGNSAYASPDQPTLDLQAQLINGALEQSNVNPIQESVKMTEVSRAYQSAAKLIKTFEDLESKTIKELYKFQ